MKNFSFLLAAACMLWLASCKPVATGETVETPPVMETFNLVMIRHAVRDFNGWNAHYMHQDTLRQAHTMSHFSAGRGLPDSNSIYIFNKFTDLEKAKAFAAMPGLAAMMDSSGVISAPTFDYFHVVRNDTTRHEVKDRVMVKHRVRDFNAWLKAYDDSGRGMREAHGLYDHGLARGSEDTNMVYVVLSVLDMDKAKERMGSIEQQKLMTDAGVEGTPEFFWYTIVE